MQLNDVQGFHIEPTNLCTLKCPGCARTRFIKQWGKYWVNHSLDIDCLFDFIDIDLDRKYVHLCGNYGDPIYHPKFLEMVKRFKAQNAELLISTNGSYQNHQWWEELFDMLDSNDQINFAIDGTPENFAQYRINADWPSIEIALEVAKKAECHTVWKYLPFNYNIDSIDQARLISEQYGIKEFRITPSDRYDEETEYLKPVDIDYLGDRYTVHNDLKNGIIVSDLKPRCYNKRNHYISADGYYSPCCYTADHRFYYKTIYGQNKSNYNIRSTTITKILEQPGVVDFYNNLQHHSVCQFNCPAQKQ